MAYDLAKRTGWAAADRGRVPVSGEVDLLPPSINALDNQGQAFAKLRRTVVDQIATFSPREIWIEQPVPTSRGGIAVMRWLMGLAAIVEEVAYAHGIECCEELPATVRYQVFGNGRASKDDVLWWCSDMGWPASGHNAGDALVLLQHAACCDGEGWTLTPGPNAQKARDDIFGRARAQAQGLARPA